MCLRKAGAVALTLCVGVSGCSPMPEIEPVTDRAERSLMTGEPLVVQSTGEPLDVPDVVPNPLTMDEALRLTLRHNPSIQAALTRVRQAESDARQTRLLPNPVIGVSLKFPTGGGQSVLDADLSAELLSLLTRPGRIEAVDHRLRAASAEALATVLDAAVQLQRQYVDVRSLDARAEIAVARRDLLQQVVEISTARLEAGETSRLDVLTARGELAELDSEIVEIQSDKQRARITLARLLGQPSNAADWELSPWELPPTPSLDQPQWVRLALTHRPELEAIRWELEALGQEVELAQAETIFGGEIGVTAEREDEWSIGPSVSLPLAIFDTGAVEKQRREALVAEQSHELTRTGRMVIEEVRQALVSLDAAESALHAVQEQLLPLQTQRMQQAQDAYRLGLSDLTSLRLAEQDLQAARSRVIDLQQQVSHARLDLDRAVGGSGVYLDNPRVDEDDSPRHSTSE